MLFDFLARVRQRAAPAAETLQVGARSVPLLVVRNPRARRYFLRVRPDGTARVTIPRGGSAAAAREFVAQPRLAGAPIPRNRGAPARFRRLANWLPGAVSRRSGPHRVAGAGPDSCRRRNPGRREERRALPASRSRPGGPGPAGRFGSNLAGAMHFRNPADLRPAIEQHLRRLATRELPVRLRELAAAHGLVARRITVRASAPGGVPARAAAYLPQLAVNPDAHPCAGLHPAPRIGAFAADEPFRTLLAGSRAALSGLRPGGALVEGASRFVARRVAKPSQKGLNR